MRYSIKLLFKVCDRVFREEESCNKKKGRKNIENKLNYKFEADVLLMVPIVLNQIQMLDTHFFF